MAEEDKTFGQRTGNTVLRFFGGTVEHTLRSGAIGAKRGAIWGGIGGGVIGGAIVGAMAVMGAPFAAAALVIGFSAWGTVRNVGTSLAAGSYGGALKKAAGLIVAGVVAAAALAVPGLGPLVIGLAGALAGGVAGAYRVGMFGAGVGGLYGLVTGGFRKIREGEKGAAVEAQKGLEEKKYRNSQMQNRLEETAAKVEALAQSGGLDPQPGAAGGAYSYQQNQRSDGQSWEQSMRRSDDQLQLPAAGGNGQQSPAVARHLRRDLQMQQTPQSMSI